MGLEPYVPGGACPKCDGAVSDRWCANCAVEGCDEPDHIHRTCQRCGYAWAAASLDKVREARAALDALRGPARLPSTAAFDDMMEQFAKVFGKLDTKVK